MDRIDAETDRLVERAQRGDRAATELLLGQHRNRLRRMINLRMDPRLAARLDASDVVQETFVEAAGKMDDYFQTPNCPFYPWLRQIALQRLSQLHRHHIHVQRRSIKREAQWNMGLPDRSALLLADQLVADDTSPSGNMLREERRASVKNALGRLKEQDREVLVMHNLERMTLKETAAALGITAAAVQSRYRRAVERLHNLLNELEEEHGE